MNKHSLPLVLSAAALILGSAATFQLFKPTRVRAQDYGCEAKTLIGSYAYALNGWVSAGNNNWVPTSVTGRGFADGAGTFQGSDTTNTLGAVSRRTYTGAYTMQKECVGSAVLQDPSGTALHFDFVLINNANEVNMIQTDSFASVAGTLKRQVPYPVP